MIAYLHQIWRYVTEEKYKAKPVYADAWPMWHEHYNTYCTFKVTNISVFVAIVQFILVDLLLAQLLKLHNTGVVWSQAITTGKGGSTSICIWQKKITNRQLVVEKVSLQTGDLRCLSPSVGVNREMQDYHVDKRFTEFQHIQERKDADKLKT